MTKKNILLIGPTSSKEMAEVKWLAPPLGIIRLAGYLNSHGHNAEYLDLNFSQVTGKGQNLEDKLREKPWDLVGFSVLEDSLANDIVNMYRTREVLPQARLVAGGIEAQFNYQTILDKSPCRIVVLGEGEVPLLKLANGEPLESIPGIVYRKDASPLSKEEFSAATHGIPWEQINFEQYWDFYLDKYAGDLTEERKDQIHTLRIFTRNRCPRKCKFCSSVNQLPWASEGATPVVDIMAEGDFAELLGRIKENHPRLRTVYFTDDDFCLNPRKVIEFSQSSIERKLDLKYICFSRVNELREDVLEWMSRAGFRAINIGVESFSQRVLEELDKDYDSEVIRERLLSVKKYGIHPFISVILVSPRSTLEDMEMTIANTYSLVKEGIADASIALACIPFKGSQLHEETFDYLTEVVPIPGTKHQIKRERMILADDPYVREAQLEFYNRIGEEVERSRERLGSVTSADQALVRLSLMQNIIEEIRKRYHLTLGVKGNPQIGRLTAYQASQGKADKYQGI